jgi:hypothetical protein
MNECTSVVGHFTGQEDAPVQFWAHCPMQHIQGYLRSYWTLPLGKYLPYIALVDAVVTFFGVKN